MTYLSLSSIISITVKTDIEESGMFGNNWPLWGTDDIPRMSEPPENQQNIEQELGSLVVDNELSGTIIDASGLFKTRRRQIWLQRFSHAFDDFNLPI